MRREDVDADLAARLVAAQHPQWAHLPVRPVALSGWDNRTFHLGDTMSVRLPSAESYAAQVAKEQEWLPRLGPLLPQPVPVPLAAGVPGEGYPWPWSVYAWLDGEPAETAEVPDHATFGAEVGAFLSALHALDASDGPAAGAHNFHRGGALSVYDDETRAALRTLEGRVDAARARALWDEALATRWERSPVWVHGDVSAANLLVRDGHLAAVIDFGSSGVGDPACDVVLAWTFLDDAGAVAFRDAVGLDEHTWARGRGWALWKALITLAGSPDDVPSARTLGRVLA